MLLKIRYIDSLCSAFDHAEFFKSRQRKPDRLKRLVENRCKHFIRIWEFIIVYNKVAENKEQIKKSLAATKETELKGDINFLDDMEPARKKAEPKKPQSKRDIMSKYL